MDAAASALPFRLPFGPERAQEIAASPAAPPADRLNACDELVQHGRPALALAALAELERLPAHRSPARRLIAAAHYVERAMAWLDFAGPGTAEGRWHSLDGAAPGAATAPTGALAWAREGATQVVLAFSAFTGGFGPMRGWNSVYLLHRFLHALPVNVVYLRDESFCLNLAGNASLGADYGACVEALARLCAARGWSRVYTLGVSNGGYSALRYGLDLGARGVLSFSGPTTLEAPLYAEQDGLKRLRAAAPAMAADLLPLYRGAARRPRLLLCYGERNAADTAMALRMRELREAVLVVLKGFGGHSTFLEIGRRRGGFEALARRLLEVPQ